MTEFIVVRFETRRRVLINGAPNGFTDDVLRVPTGPHRITLDPRDDITPSFRRPLVAGTSQNAPMEILFSRLAPVAVKAVAKAAKATAKAAGKSRRKRARKKARTK